MKKIFILFSFLLFINCSDNTIENDCFNNINISGTISLSLPQFINLRVPGGYASANISGRSIIIINRSSRFQAFDLTCPEGDCTSNMTFDGLKLICPCSEKEYNSLNGSPIDGNGCPVLEYDVLQTSSSTLQISI